jgi:hypothetical protein
VVSKIDEWGRQARSGNSAAGLTDQQLLFNKLRGVLERTKSPIEQEAQVAASVLARLLEEHNLSVADLEQRGQQSPGVREDPHDLGKAAFPWKLNLADGIAEFYYCIPLVNRDRKTVAFIGRPDNVEALQLLYGWVIDQVKRIATEERRKHFDSTGEHIDPLRWQLAFGLGAAARLIERMREMKARQQEDLSRDDLGNITSLAVHHASEASDYLESKYGYRTDGRKTKVQLEHEARWQRQSEAKDALRIRCEESGDMEPFYKDYPWDRPDTPEDIAARDKYYKQVEARERRNAARRKGPAYRDGPATDWNKIEQQGTARAAGRSSADRVNLQPFLGGNVDRKKVK